jgi:hypothetical protein
MNLRRSLVWLGAVVFVVSCEVGPARAAERIDPTGTWTWVRELEGQEGQSVLTLSYKDGKLTGLYKRLGQVVPIANAKFDKNEVSFEADGKWNEQKVHGKFNGKLSHDAINGSIEIIVEDGSLPLAWVAKRGVDADDLVGNWKLKVATPSGETMEPRLKLSADGGSLKGTYTSSRFGEHEAKEIKLNGSELSWTIEFERNGQTFKAAYKGSLEGNAIKGTLVLDSAGKATSLTFNGERTAPKTETATKEEGKKHAQNPETHPKANTKPAEGKSTDGTPAKRRAIVMLKGRQAILVVYSATGKEHEPAFSILSTAGKELAKEISLKDLQASYPLLYKEYRTSFASLWAVGATRAAAKHPADRAPRSNRSNALYRGVDFAPE